MSALAANRIGRTALAIHALGMAPGMGVELVHEALRRGDRLGDVLPFLGVLAAMAVVLILWSCVLAARAIRAGEPLDAPVAALAMTLVEASVLSILHYNPGANRWIEQWGLPVFVPVSTIAILCALALAWWRTRKAEAAAGPAWTRERRVKYGLFWFLPAFTLLMCVCLPVPLFLFCAEQSILSGKGWQNWAVAHTPVIVGEASAIALSPWRTGGGSSTYEYILATGKVRQARLLGELSLAASPDKVFALWGLLHRDMKTAFDSAVKCDVEIETLGSLRLFPELIPDFERFAEAEPKYRGRVLKILAHVSTPEHSESLAKEYLKDTDEKRLLEAVAMADDFRSDDVRIRIIALCLSHPNPQVRLKALKLNSHGRQLTVELATSLNKLLDDPSLEQRRYAAIWLDQFLNLPSPFVGTQYSDIKKSKAESEEEILVRKQIRMEKWLESHKE